MRVRCSSVRTRTDADLVLSTSRRKRPRARGTHRALLNESGFGPCRSSIGLGGSVAPRASRTTEALDALPAGLGPDNVRAASRRSSRGRRPARSRSRLRSRITTRFPALGGSSGLADDRCPPFGDRDGGRDVPSRLIPALDSSSNAWGFAPRRPAFQAELDALAEIVRRPPTAHAHAAPSPPTASTTRVPDAHLRAQLTTGPIRCLSRSPRHRRDHRRDLAAGQHGVRNGDRVCSLRPHASSTWGARTSAACAERA